MYDQYLKKIPNKFGVYSEIQIPANTPICEFHGRVFLYEELKTVSFKPENALQIGPNKFLAPSGDIDDYIAHSCNPNCYVHACGNRAILYSLYVIPANGEITFDYSASSTDNHDEWKMVCKCGQYNCRKIISGFHYLDENIQNEYKKKNIAALFIRVPIFNKNF